MKEYLSGLCHIGIPCHDLEETAAFYEAIGFTRGYRNEAYKVVFMDLGNLVIEIYEAQSVANKTGAIDHIAIACSEACSCIYSVIM